jgi:hypothetical protein
MRFCSKHIEVDTLVFINLLPFGKREEIPLISGLMILLTAKLTEETPSTSSSTYLTMP